MRRTITTLCYWLAATAAAVAQDVTLKHPGGAEETFKAPTRDPAVVYRLFETVAENLAGPGDELTLNSNATGGRFDQLVLTDTGLARLTVPAGVTLLMTSQHDVDGDKPAGPSIQLAPKMKVDGRGTLKQVCHDIREDAALLGVAYGVKACDITIENVTLDGSLGCDYVVYGWEIGEYRYTLRGVLGLHSRQMIGLDHNNATYHVTLERCTFYGDAAGSQTYAETSRVLNEKLEPVPDDGGVLGCVVRGKGLWRVRDCDFYLKGLAADYQKKFGCPRLAALTNHYSTKSNSGLVTDFEELRIYLLDAGNAERVWDLDFRFGVVANVKHSNKRPRRSCGTGADGSFRIRPAEAVR